MDLSEISQQIANVAANYKYKAPPDFLIQLQNWVQSFMRFIHDLLSALHIDLGGAADTRMASDVMQIILWTTGLVCLALFMWAMWNRFGQLKQQANLARKGQTSGSEILDAYGWKEQAQSLAAQAKFREACRAVYFAALRTMDESKLLEFSPSRSNYEYFYSLARRPEIAKDFRRLANLVESSWFGKRVATQADFDEVQELLSKIEKACTMHLESLSAEAASTGGAL